MKRLYVVFAVVAMLFSACAKEDNNTELKPMSFVASVSDGSKAGIREDLKQGFANGDKITLWDGTACHIFTAAGSGTPNSGFYPSATFSGEAAESGNYVAVYPASEMGYTFGTTTISDIYLPMGQTAVKGSYDPEAAVMVAVSTTKALNFINLCAFIKFVIPNDTPASDLENFTSLQLFSDGTNIAGMVTYNMSTGALTSAEEPGDCNSLELVCESGFEPGEYYIAILPGTYTLEFLAAIGDMPYQYELPSAKTFVKGHVYTLSLSKFEEAPAT